MHTCNIIQSSVRRARAYMALYVKSVRSGDPCAVFRELAWETLLHARLAKAGF